VITDLNMPNMRGDELIQHMAQDAKLKDIPVVVVSTEGSHTRLDEVVLPFAAGFIRKPFTPEQVRETIFNVLEQIS
jgi:two-component system chemotaxis response regulator CheY